jgi:hypothetical protein
VLTEGCILALQVERELQPSLLLLLANTGFGENGEAQLPKLLIERCRIVPETLFGYQLTPWLQNGIITGKASSIENH